LGGPGALRPVKFAKYLPQFGFKPVILTRKDVAYHSFDQELGTDVDALQVIRTDSLDPARLLYQLGMRRYVVKKWHGAVKQTVNFPDNKTPWMPFAYGAGRKIEFDYILATAPPFSTFITGYYLAKGTGKPFIADFRDTWLEFPFMPYKGGLQKGFVRKWEKKIVDAARFIVVVDDNIRNSLLDKYPGISEKVCVIPNGYDPDDFAQIERPDVFTISYLGTIRGERNPENVLRAVDDFVTEQRIGIRNVKFRFIGHIEEHFLNGMRKYPFVESTGHLPYKKAINAFCNSHLAMLITTGSEYFFPSRQNEYLASGLPIILCGKSKGLHVLEGAFKKGYPGWVFDFEDLQGMKRKISDIYQMYRRGIVVKGKTPYDEYTREKLTQRLAELIEEI
jgi:glycosyltransferase involved in cell wall biosynthesis